MTRPALTAIAIWALTVLACGDGEPRTPVAQVAAASQCPAERCASLQEVQAALGFKPLEPAYLPADFQLYARRIESFDLPMQAREAQARARGVPLSEIPERSAPSLAMEYRFRDSQHVLAIVVREDAVDAPVTSLEPESPGCAERVTLPAGPALYGVGLGRIGRGPTPGSWVGCAQVTPNDRQVHVVMLASGSVMVHLRAFHESNLTRDDVIRMAASMRPVP